MAYKIWLRVALPDPEWTALRDEFPGCEFRRGSDAAMEREWLRDVAAVFTEPPLADDLVPALPALRWLHVICGGAVAYLTPEIRLRPIAVTGSKGIHGPAFSEFALACILLLAKQLPRCLDAQR